ncbi:4-hydroxy-tetrahydrodipicolinate reductase [Inhella inkyongensis]|uniref:4-hydroxy-tetrahydrodipicolinate reductase n=1 Tax=Inhella inkyongensis TaxID=392593 RepID=A0A840S2E7_9BURK|nr:4-hydroxy-tetrahydrodipicolinate reductase [Inhella inkyongensis]MBB5203024.1 4-hydroxy-tetrahydrodipicolinate reductase [Inhella inkyongensis]
MSDPTPLKIALAGASGRMGRMLVEQVLQAPDLQLAGALVHAGSDSLGLDAGAFKGLRTGVPMSSDPDLALGAAQVLIDYSRVEASLALLQRAVARGLPIVIGTTGFSAEQRAQMQVAGQLIPVLWAPNTSVGVNVVMDLLRQAALRLGAEYDVEIVEAHHRHKVDAPSGTALQMGEVIAQARGQALAEVATLSREGHTGARERGRIGFATVRGGDIVGDHTVMFCGEGERIEIAHKSSSRLHYAQGALLAARWLARQPAGFYSMADALGLT